MTPKIKHPSEGGRRHAVSGKWIKWEVFTLAVDISDSTRVPWKKFAVIPPANPTNTSVVLYQETEPSNEDATTGTATYADIRWSLMAPGHLPPVHLPRRTCSVK